MKRLAILFLVLAFAGPTYAKCDRFLVPLKWTRRALVAGSLAYAGIAQGPSLISMIEGLNADPSVVTSVEVNESDLSSQSVDRLIREIVRLQDVANHATSEGQRLQAQQELKTLFATYPWAAAALIQVYQPH